MEQPPVAVAVFSDQVWSVLFGKPLTDDEISEWYFIRTVYPTYSILIFYFLFVYKIGPDFMKNRPAYDLKIFLLIYNAAQILMNGYLATSAFIIIVGIMPFDVGCVMPHAPNSHIHRMENLLYYYYFINKIMDLLDTVFMVLRKNNRQITFLHVYHHIMMVLAALYINRIFGSGGHSSSMGTFNTLVHTLMYTYYLLSAFSDKLKSKVWIKKSITLIQIIQFIIITIHNLWPIIMRPDCKFPKVYNVVIILQCIVMMILFANFYWKTYVRPKSLKIK